MALTFAQLIGEVGSILHLDTTSGSEDETTIKRALNWAGRYIWTARPWPERDAETILTTVAPYSTGTADFTNNSTALAGNGTTWTGFAGRKAALALNAPFYRIASVGSATAATLARAYIEATALATPYVIYQDEYNVGAAVETITSAYLLRNNAEGPMLKVARETFDAETLIPTGAGAPRVLSLATPTTVGTPRIRVSPVPDAVYGILVRYKKGWTDLASGGDYPVLDANKEALLVECALVFAQRSGDNRPVSSYQQVDSLIETFWRKNQAMGPVVFQRQGFNYPAGPGGVTLNIVG